MFLAPVAMGAARLGWGRIATLAFWGVGRRSTGGVCLGDRLAACQAETGGLG